jgi:hypothetical protein
MIIAKYIFTISVDEDWKKFIDCTCPPYNVGDKELLILAKEQLYNVIRYCEEMYDNCDKMLLELPEEWNNLTDLPVEYEAPSTGKQ